LPYKPIEDYGAIGDMRTLALVGLDGSIDFFCAPDFDSPSVFAAMLDDAKGGHFSVAPDFEKARRSQLYVPDTNILITRFMAQDSILEIIDFMPIGSEDDLSKIIRIVWAVRGTIPVSIQCRPALDYGRASHQVDVYAGKDTAFFSQGGKNVLCLHSTMPLEKDDGAATARFTLKAGESAYFLLDCAAEKDMKFSGKHIEVLLTETIGFWRAWVDKITYRGRWRDIVNRSALVLKLMTSRRYGSIIAAPTFSLPEAIGGRRNWDYRYCWIRDSAFTIYAFIRLGLKEEAIAFMKWVEEIYRKSGETQGELQLMYRINGDADLNEEELPNFEGYRKSSPVRIGNEAYRQFQLDIYGELMDAVALANKHVTKISYDAWRHVARTADYVCDNWRRPDAGIWEFRGERRQFLHSRLMCWVALDRILRLARDESLPAETKRWMDTRAEIYNDIFDNFWNDDLKSFVQHKNASAVDASALMMPLVDFIGAHDPRWMSTLKAIEDHLANDTLVRRYRIDKTDLRPVDTSNEGSFNAACFWYISCLARVGRKDDAWLLFSKMIGYANHLDLYAEEMTSDGRQLGNFPQALSHLALINTVFALEESNNKERADMK
jgi:GH15 family glucan-1,4-alpha-glucosidase